MNKTNDRKLPFVIAIEGVDGSGKETQAQLLGEFLKTSGYTVAYKSYPVYTSFFGKEIGTLLSSHSGTYSAKNLDPKSMSLWYALDRWLDYQQITEEMGNADFLIFNRYTLSSVIYQSQRSGDPCLEDWIEMLENDILQLPRPNIYVILDVDTHVSYDNVIRKSKRDYIDHMEHDVYEGDNNLQLKVRSKYLEFAQKTANSILIKCIDDKGEMLNPNDIQSLILEHIENMDIFNAIRPRE